MGKHKDEEILLTGEGEIDRGGTQAIVSAGTVGMKYSKNASKNHAQERSVKNSRS